MRRRVAYLLHSLNGTLDGRRGAFLPRWHTKGKLASRTRCATTFDQEIDATALPPNIDQLKVQYRLPAGGLAIHDTMIPHSSRPNRSSRWRRVLVLRYMSAEGEMGPKMHQDYRTGQPFPRRFFLVRSQDLGHQELERNPYEPMISSSCSVRLTGSKTDHVDAGCLHFRGFF